MSKAKRVAATIYGWPDVMRTALAADYVGGSKWKIFRAVEAGDLHPAGRQGRSFTFTKTELDRYLLGSPLVEAAETQPHGSRSNAPSNGNALERIDAIRRGSKP